MKIIALENINKLAFKTALKIHKENDLIQIKSTRFTNGEGKIRINEKLENEEITILTDTSNYSISYNLRGKKHYMSPDEHYQDLIRLISILKGNKINVIMPLLYESRQHRYNECESLDSLLTINTLKQMGVENIITYDAHDPKISKKLINIMPINDIAKHIGNTDIVIAPDKGALNRASMYAKIKNANIGTFHKIRSNITINGKNEILKHTYIGPNVKNKQILIVDDMIASGDSILDTCKKLKLLGAKSIDLAVTFSLFTSGIEKFNEYNKKGYFNKIYTTNLNYQEFENIQYLNIIDMSANLGKVLLKK